MVHSGAIWNDIRNCNENIFFCFYKTEHFENKDAKLMVPSDAIWTDI